MILCLEKRLINNKTTVKLIKTTYAITFYLEYEKINKSFFSWHTWIVCLLTFPVVNISAVSWQMSDNVVHTVVEIVWTK